jgi:tetratricopeptide (TPR) repeat protein
VTLLLLTLWSLTQATVQETMREAIALVDQGQIDEARTLLEGVVSENPRHGPARLLLGQIAVSRGNWDAAIEHLEIAVESDSQRPQRLFLAWYLLGRARRATGDGAGARESFARAIDLAPRFLPVRLELGEMAAEEGDLWTALEQYRRALQIEPGRVDILPALANTARRMGATDLARCAVDAALAKEPSNGALHYLRCVIESGDTAIESCRRALELGFDNAAVYTTLGNLLHEKSDIEGSIAAFEKAVAIDPAAAESLAAFAITSLTSSEYERLGELLERHVESHPDSINTLYGLGGMYLRENDLDAALKVFERLASLVPGASQVHYNLAMIHRRRGEKSAAERETARFRELKAKEDEEWNRQNELHRDRLRAGEAIEGGDFPEAERLGRHLLESGDPTTEDFLLLGNALSGLGRHDEARRVLDRGLTLYPYERDLLTASLAEAEATGDATTAGLYRERLSLLDPSCVPDGS